MHTGIHRHWMPVFSSQCCQTLEAFSGGKNKNFQHKTLARSNPRAWSGIPWGTIGPLIAPKHQIQKKFRGETFEVMGRRSDKILKCLAWNSLKLWQTQTKKIMFQKSVGVPTTWNSFQAILCQLGAIKGNYRPSFWPIFDYFRVCWVSLGPSHAILASWGHFSHYLPHAVISQFKKNSKMAKMWSIMGGRLGRGPLSGTGFQIWKKKQPGRDWNSVGGMGCPHQRQPGAKCAAVWRTMCWRCVVQRMLSSVWPTPTSPRSFGLKRFSFSDDTGGLLVC